MSRAGDKLLQQLQAAEKGSGNSGSLVEQCSVSSALTMISAAPQSVSHAGVCMRVVGLVMKRIRSKIIPV